MPDLPTHACSNRAEQGNAAICRTIPLEVCASNAVLKPILTCWRRQLALAHTSVQVTSCHDIALQRPQLVAVKVQRTTESMAVLTAEANAALPAP